MNNRALFAGICCLTLLTGISNANAQTYSFTIDPAHSGMKGTLAVQAKGAGSLIGNYDVSTNPTGTRTKPGTTGAFGATENLPVTIAPTFSVTGPVTTQLGGTFQLTLTSGSRKVELSGYQANPLTAGPVTIASSMSINNQAFRTKNPTFVYPAVQTPVGLTLMVSSLTITQVEETAEGTLIPTRKGSDLILVPFKAKVAGSYAINGKIYSFERTIPMTLSGTIVFGQGTAQITSSMGLGGISLSLPSPITLPTFPLPLPALQGQPAHVLVTMTVNQASLSLGGTHTFTANGTL